MLFLAFLWLLYYTIHSLLAAEFVKKSASRVMGKGFRVYRLAYNLFSILGFVAIWYYQRQMALEYVFAPNELHFLIGGILIILGIAIGVLVFYQYRWQEFFGIDQLRIHSPKPASILVTHGFHKHVRHPLYFAGIFILVGNFLLHTSLQVLIFTLITLIYLIVGTILEEKKLINEFGDAYRDYQKKVKMLIPYIF